MKIQWKQLRWKRRVRLAACAAAGLCIGLPWQMAAAQDDETSERPRRPAAREEARRGPPPGPPPEGRLGRRGPGRPGPGGPPDGFRGPGGPPGGFRGPGGPPEGRRGPEMLLRLPVIAALDADRDGVISADEIANASAALKTLDRNQDGMIDFLEMRPSIGPGGPPEGDRPRGERGAEGREPSREGGFARGGEAMIDRLMERDEDGDGLLSAEEVPPFMARLVERADANEDGKLSREELVKAMTQRGRGMRRGGGRPGAERETPGAQRETPGAERETPDGERPRRPPPQQ